MNYRKKNWCQISVLVILIGLLFGCKNKVNNKRTNADSRVATLPFYNEATYTPHWFDLRNDSLKKFHKIPDFKFVNQDSVEVTQKTFDNKIYIADFFFTSCPGICPTMTKNMTVLQDAFKNDDDVLLISHSVTPTKDSVSVLKSYAEKNKVLSNKWHLVTGARKDIYDIGRFFYFAEEDLGEVKSKEDFLHTENFVLIDKNKHIRGIYNGLNKTDMQQIIIDIETLKTE